MPRENGWNEYKKLVLHEMQENGHRFERIFAAITDLQKDVSGLKVKAAVAGGIGGLIGTAILSLLLKAWS